MKMKETPQKAGYKYKQRLSKGEFVFTNTYTGQDEVFFCNKNHASWGLIWRNTHLEFAHIIKQTK